VDGRLRCIETGPQERDAAVTQTPDERAADVWALPQHRHRLPASPRRQRCGDVHRVAAEAHITPVSRLGLCILNTISGRPSSAHTKVSLRRPRRVDLNTTSCHGKLRSPRWRCTFPSVPHRQQGSTFRFMCANDRSRNHSISCGYPLMRKSMSNFAETVN
jgi:hypothetical protein